MRRDEQLVVAVRDLRVGPRGAGERVLLVERVRHRRGLARRDQLARARARGLHILAALLENLREVACDLLQFALEGDYDVARQRVGLLVTLRASQLAGLLVKIANHVLQVADLLLDDDGELGDVLRLVVKHGPPLRELREPLQHLRGGRNLLRHVRRALHKLAPRALGRGPRHVRVRRPLALAVEARLDGRPELSRPVLRQHN